MKEATSDDSLNWIYTQNAGKGDVSNPFETLLAEPIMIITCLFGGVS